MLRFAGRCETFFAILLIALTIVCTAGAQEFRVETDVYMGDDAESTSHTVTLFEKSAVYDFVDGQSQIVVYQQESESRNAQFILLDTDTKRRTEIDVKRIAGLMTKLTKWAATQDDPILKFAAEPRFEEKFDSESGDLSLTSEEWTYRVATIPAEDPKALTRYQDYADRYAELSTMLYGAAPAGPRHALDASLAKHKAIPVEIRRITGGDEKNQVRAAHLFSWRLSRDDRSRLDEAQEFLTSFEKVGNEAFLTAQRKHDKEVVRGQSE